MIPSVALGFERHWEPFKSPKQRGSMPDSTSDDDFNKRAEERFRVKAVDFSKTLNIAVIGKVSAGKSSLINAFLLRTRESRVADVGAVSGVTTGINVYRLDDRTTLVDSPGLDDVKSINSEVTRSFLGHVDVGIFVVTGSADQTQKKNLDELRAVCDEVFVVLNKVDEWDDLEESALDEVINQWKAVLQVEVLFPTSTKGYDPKSRAGTSLQIRGVDALRTAVETFLEKEGKELFLARQMGEKSKYATRIVAGALAAVAGEAFVPGSAAWITGTQAAAICSLYYLYTGKILAPKQALASLPAFAAEAIGTNLFLWAKSFLPPTGVVDIAAAGVAVSVTLAMLTAVNSLFASGHELHERELLRGKFEELRQASAAVLRNSSASDWKSPAFWQSLVRDFMYRP